ncbi:F-box/WD repeat-containing protein pof1 [Ephemerocybe angulata]|uniref:F-box/WD repeat-containing protein pof1 n=1 Tax=Ephemerocybe angulata TaxID=980116 RepID=A0A8H6MH85_9AGAR|nr:F-box/WD repeat-containing protein pof1 [Tulosesus angulatus]
MQSQKSSYVCDTIPAARLASSTDLIAMHDPEEPLPEPPSRTPTPVPPRKLCVRHQRMADEGMNLKLQHSLDALPIEEREAVNAVWTNFSQSSHPRRALILQGLLTMCCFSQLSLLTDQLSHLIRIDPFAVLPRELAMTILGHLDATSLCRAAQNKRMCYRPQSVSPSPNPPPSIPLPSSTAGPSSPSTSLKRSAEASSELLAPPVKRQRSDDDVYSERLTIERNWRRGRCTVRILKGHTDGVMCLQFNETLSHPAFPVLITGSYDRTIRVWNMETGQELHCLKGHTRAVRALQFDECKLITGSMDNTLKGHTEGVVCLNFDSNVLASGSVDSTIKVWNLRTGGAFTLRGHTDWVNAVQLWDSNGKSTPTDFSSLFDGSKSPPPAQSSGSCGPCIDPGKMLFSASDDGTIKLWDLTLRACVRVFTGHVGQVQSMKLLVSEDCSEGDSDSMDVSTPDAKTLALPVDNAQPSSSSSSSAAATEVPAKGKKPLLISGSLDNTIRVWDIESGTVTKTLFGHIEGVWGVAADKLRLVSGSHDRTIKVWNREDSKCTATLVGHQAAVSCLALGEDKIVSGSDDNDIRIWSFSE